MDIHRFQWISMVVHRCQWVSMKITKYQQASLYKMLQISQLNMQPTRQIHVRNKSNCCEHEPQQAQSQLL